jgi:predicted amidohydrolase
MLIAAYQFSPDPTDPAGNVERAVAAARAASAKGALLIALPELFVTSFAFKDLSSALHESQRAIARLEQVSAECGLAIAGSTITPSPAGPPYNTAVVIEGGAVRSQYHKTHLFTPTREDAAFAAGSTAPVVVDTAAGRVGAVICYDLRFPGVCRALFHQRADVMVVPAQWASERSLQFRALAMGRAVENQCVVVAVNRTGSEASAAGVRVEFPGKSLIATAFGEIVAEGGPGEQWIVADVDLAKQAALRRLIPCARDQRSDLDRESGTRAEGRTGK